MLRHHKSFVWFKRWVAEGYTVTQLARESGHSRWKIRQILYSYLDHPPAVHALKSVQRILVDGTYFKRKRGLVAVMNSDGHAVIYGKFGVTEGPRGMSLVCRELLERGCSPKIATIDGSPSVRQALTARWPEITIQRCLVHIQRQGLMWCRQNPKTGAGKRLREFFLHVTRIHSYKERDDFLSEVEAWERRFGHSIASAKETGWVLSDLKRARSMLLKALPDMFHYLDDPSISKTTNGLEGYFARLKDRYRDHRGLSAKRRGVYFQWFIYLCPR